MTRGRDNLRDLHYSEYSQYKKNFCERCKQKNYKMAGNYKVKVKLTVHHIDRNVENNKEDNLMTLCRKCHDEIHNY